MLVHASHVLLNESLQRVIPSHFHSFWGQVTNFPLSFLFFVQYQGKKLYVVFPLFLQILNSKRERNSSWLFTCGLANVSCVQSCDVMGSCSKALMRQLGEEGSLLS